MKYLIIIMIFFSYYAEDFKINSEDESYAVINAFFRNRDIQSVSEKTIDLGERKNENVHSLRNWEEAGRSLANSNYEKFDIDLVFGFCKLKEIFEDIEAAKPISLDKNLLLQSIKLSKAEVDDIPQGRYHISFPYIFKGLNGQKYALLYAEQLSEDRSSGQGSYYLFQYKIDQWIEVFSYPIWIA